MSDKQPYIDRISSNIDAANALKIDEYIENAKKNNEENKQKDINTLSEGYDSQITVTQDAYNNQIDNTKIAYEDDYQKNAVEKIINERQIAEKNANLGLTDSGLNRTQQTAVQLSYANQKGRIDAARQSAINELELSLTNAITTLQNEKASGIREIENKWDNLSVEQGTNEYNTQLNYYQDQIESDTEALTEIEKQEQQIANEQWQAALDANTELQKEAIRVSANSGNKNDDEEILLYNWKGETVLDDNGTVLLKFTGTDGKSYNVTPGKNPYTNTQNAKISDIVDGKCTIDEDWQDKNLDSANAITRACAKYGVFSNGYQPKGVCYYDNNGKVVDAGGLKSTTRKDYMNGRLQTVWYAEKTNTYWIWDGSSNEYMQYYF